MKWVVDNMFYCNYRISQEASPEKDHVFHAKMAVGFFMLMPYAFVLVSLAWRLTGWNAVDWVAHFWPLHHPAMKLGRATDGLAIVLCCLMYIYIFRRYSDEYVKVVLSRFSSPTTNECFLPFCWGVALMLSGFACLYFTTVGNNFGNAMLLLFLALSNWKVYQRYYKNT